MANDCSYAMRIQGNPDNVNEFIKLIQAEYYYDQDGECNVERHLWRVFDAYLDEEYIENGIKTAVVSGTCAWSVYSCMCDGPHTYQSQYPNHNGTTLAIESERLRLAIEVFSEECGCQFMEHMVFINGKEIINDCVDWKEYCTSDYDSIEDMNRECGTNFTEDEFNSEDFLSIGGMDWTFSDWSEELTAQI